jgi:hypothetical protein
MVRKGCEARPRYARQVPRRPLPAGPRPRPCGEAGDAPVPLRRPDHLAFLALASRKKRVRTAVVLLRDAWDGAGDLHLAPQEFAVEVGQLRADGLTNTDLRWLIGKGYVEHLYEMPAGAKQARAFRRESSLSITQASCFVLTEEGHSALSGWAEPSDGHSCRPGEGERSGIAPRSSHPRWDAEQRELCWARPL